MMIRIVLASESIIVWYFGSSSPLSQQVWLHNEFDKKEEDKHSKEEKQTSYHRNHLTGIRIRLALYYVFNKNVWIKKRNHNVNLEIKAAFSNTGKKKNKTWLLHSVISIYEKLASEPQAARRAQEL